MCGICGELRFDGAAVSSERISAMTDTLARRGPDSAGQYLSGAMGFGHRRLSVIDLSDASAQPFIDKKTGMALVFNGAIYNYKELRRDLIAKGHEFTSQGDTEVILRAYMEWGEDSVSRLHGMFAYAIWNPLKQQLFLARDRLGIKPLYISRVENAIRFASNTQALLVSGGVDSSIDPVALHHQFTLHAVIPAPRTLLKGIAKLEPAHSLTIGSDGSERKQRYWTLSAQRPPQHRHEIEWIELVHQALKRAVDRRMQIADVPVGVLLSGGLDSSLLVGLLAEAGASKIQTYSIGFEDIGDEYGSEFYYSDQVVERFATQHHKLAIPNSEVLPRLPEAVAQMAEPMFGQDAVAFYLLSEQVSKTIKVVQSGQGADEVFGGYFWYPQMQQAEGDDLTRFAKHYFDRDHDEYLQTVSDAYRGDDYTSQLVAQKLRESNGETFLDRVLHFDVTTLIVDDPVKRVDNMTMAWGLEARVPFLDHELVEIAAAMPPELKLKSNGKHPLKYISRGLLPDDVIDRPKGYFPMPALKFVRGEFLQFMRDILDSNACRQRNLFNRQYVDKLLSEPESHFTRLQGSKLWHLALLELWLQLHVDKLVKS